MTPLGGSRREGWSRTPGAPLIASRGGQPSHGAPAEKLNSGGQHELPRHEFKSVSELRIVLLNADHKIDVSATARAISGVEPTHICSKATEEVASYQGVNVDGVLDSTCDVVAMVVSRSKGRNIRIVAVHRAVEHDGPVTMLSFANGTVRDFVHVQHNGVLIVYAQEEAVSRDIMAEIGMPATPRPTKEYERRDREFQHELKQVQDIIEAVSFPTDESRESILQSIVRIAEAAHQAMTVSGVRTNAASHYEVMSMIIKVAGEVPSLRSRCVEYAKHIPMGYGTVPHLVLELMKAANGGFGDARVLALENVTRRNGEQPDGLAARLGIIVDFLGIGDSNQYNSDAARAQIATLLVKILQNREVHALGNSFAQDLQKFRKGIEGFRTVLRRLEEAWAALRVTFRDQGELSLDASIPVHYASTTSHLPQATQLFFTGEAGQQITVIDDSYANEPPEFEVSIEDAQDLDVFLVRSGNDRRKCYLCESTDHLWRECPQRDRIASLDGNAGGRVIRQDGQKLLINGNRLARVMGARYMESGQRAANLVQGKGLTALKDEALRNARRMRQGNAAGSLMSPPAHQ